MELEATLADDDPSPHTIHILSWQDSRERSMYEDISQTATFENACTIREYKLQAGLVDDHPCISPVLR
eukprot:1896299-Pyramimonas_sp.AAC.1